MSKRPAKHPGRDSELPVRYAAQRRGQAAPRAERPGAAARTIRGAVQELQRTAGNAAVRRIADDPLEPTMRLAMEAQLGADLGHVRVRSDDDADAQASRIGAAAFTQGSSITFSVGMYRPGTQAGRLVLAHELAHVVQQTRRVGRPSLEPAELEAEADAAATLGGPVVGNASLAGIQALPDPHSAPGKPDAENEATRRFMISEADRKIAEIDDALVNGYIWWFEREFFTKRTQAQVAALGERARLLRELAGHCSELIASLSAGDDYRVLHEALDVRSDIASHELNSALHEFMRARYRDSTWFRKGMATGDLAGYAYFRPDAGKAVLPPDKPTGAPRAAQGAAPATPPPVAAPEVTRERESESTGWTIEVPEPAAEPTVVRELLPPGMQASRAHLYPRTTKLFPLKRERAGGRFYYFGPRGVVYLPDLLEQFPAAATDAPRETEPASSSEPDPSVRRRVNRPRF